MEFPAVVGLQADFEPNPRTRPTEAAPTVECAARGRANRWCSSGCLQNTPGFRLEFDRACRQVATRQGRAPLTRPPRRRQKPVYEDNLAPWCMRPGLASRHLAAGRLPPVPKADIQIHRPRRPNSAQSMKAFPSAGGPGPAALPPTAARVGASAFVGHIQGRA